MFAGNWRLHNRGWIAAPGLGLIDRMRSDDAVLMELAKQNYANESSVSKSKEDKVKSESRHDAAPSIGLRLTRITAEIAVSINRDEFQRNQSKSMYRNT